MMRRRLLLMSKKSELPNGYKRCEYLESTGTQYIDTGYKIGPSLSSFEYRYRFDNLYAQRLFGLIYDEIFYQHFINTNPLTMGIQMGLENWNDEIFSAICDTAIHNIVVDLDKRIAVIDGKSNSIYSDKSKSSPCSLYLFARNANGLTDKYAYAKLYSFVIKDNGNVARNFIPAIDRSGRPCMYDTVTKQPFYNKGTGEFGYELMDGTYVAPV